MAANGRQWPNSMPWVIAGAGLSIACWLPVLSSPIPTFYKEWVYVLGLGAAGLMFGPAPIDVRANCRHPLVLAALAVLFALVVQSLVMEGVWRKALLFGGCAAFFVYALSLGRSMRLRMGDRSLEWIAVGVLVAAAGSCAAALLQIAHVESALIIALVGGRLYANLAQANHFADLLWLGSVSALLLYARSRINWWALTGLLIVLQAFAVGTGSRMIWIYTVILALAGCAILVRRPPTDVRRFALGLITLAVVYVGLAGLASLSGVSEALGIMSAERRASVPQEGASSTRLRLWLWRAGIDAAAQHPALGVGVGRFPGHAFDYAMHAPDAPAAAADANAHNLIIHLAAELGVPLAMSVLLCLIWWIVATWRQARFDLSTLFAVTMSWLILIHAGLEHPLWYLYFIGTLGLLAGHTMCSPRVAETADAGRPAAEMLRFSAFVVLLAAAFLYSDYARVERATREVQLQLRQGMAPQPSPLLKARLENVPTWSLFGDYAQAISLISAVPARNQANELATRCDRALRVGPAPHLLARCATVHQVAGNVDRATYLADATCKLYPGAEHVLIESLVLLARTSPEVEALNTRCLVRVDPPR